MKISNREADGVAQAKRRAVDLELEAIVSNAMQAQLLTEQAQPFR